MTTASDPNATPPLVSIVIPTCNRSDVLSRCLEALSAQTCRNFEIVIIDDASTDDTPTVIRRYAPGRDDVQVIRLRNDAHAGANPSRNRGIAVANGALVAFLDCDCIAEPAWLERLIAPLTADNTRRIAATTGMVLDAPPHSAFDLTFKGTHRIQGAGAATRLIAGNMCIRRDLLLRYRLDEDRAEQLRTSEGTPDVSVSGRGDEEGVHLILRAAGYQLLAVPDAVVLHEHHLGRRAFFRQAFRGGRSAARLVYKYDLPQRLDMAPFLLAILTTPLGFIWRPLFALPALFFAAAIAAITYNDLFRKRKTLFETLITFPLLLVYYLVRVCGYVSESIRLRVSRHDVRRTRLADFRGDADRDRG
ncbi:MAG: glycosyltransferase [Phycisphaerales bacterium]|nr:glycosyltransferase [Phycisphaerales bacterium]